MYEVCVSVEVGMMTIGTLNKVENPTHTKTFLSNLLVSIGVRASPKSRNLFIYHST